jgi:hypothetical protein
MTESTHVKIDDVPLATDQIRRLMEDRAAQNLPTFPCTIKAAYGNVPGASFLVRSDGEITLCLQQARSCEPERMEISLHW